MEDNTTDVAPGATEQVTTQEDQTLEPGHVQEVIPEVEDPLTKLINARTGNFEVKIGYAELKYLKNHLQSKIEWKGPNEAYLLIMATLSISDIIKGMDPKTPAAVPLQFPATIIESLNYFINKVKGTGIDSAQKLFSIAMMFRPATEAISKLDKQIESLNAAPAEKN